jgi:hypothetical protein
MDGCLVVHDPLRSDCRVGLGGCAVLINFRGLGAAGWLAWNGLAEVLQKGAQGEWTGCLAKGCQLPGSTPVISSLVACVDAHLVPHCRLHAGRCA